MQVQERFLTYVHVHTTSDETTGTSPSTGRQFDLAHLLEKELKTLGLSDVYADDHCYVYANIPATPGMEHLAPIGFIAHMDTSPDCSGENVRPQIIPNYDCGDVVLAGTGDILSPDAFPTLKKLAGMTLITTDGTTLLGADDKAGIAEIVTACEQVLSSGKPHGKICIAFTPDEEIGAGVDHFDLERFGASYAYTVDGGEEGELAFETFNAASAVVDITGLSVHPGSAKDTMVNAALLAMEFNSLLPAGDIPRLTEGYEGFFHLTDMSGSIENARLSYIIRDHDHALFEGRKAMMLHAAKVLNEKYGQEFVRVTLRDSYYNMREKIEPYMFLVENAEKAIQEAGMTPFIYAVRGGTDGSRLSYMGLPTPNLCTGGFAYHGRFEHVAVESMERCTKMVELLMCTYR
ncbi:MAG: peptidase T [Clostridia bacterium]|nr:peptidase T [Clostridia bacterium]